MLKAISGVNQLEELDDCWVVISFESRAEIEMRPSPSLSKIRSVHERLRFVLRTVGINPGELLHRNKVNELFLVSINFRSFNQTCQRV